MKIEHNITIPEDYPEQRLDQALAQLLPQYSRAQCQLWIKAGAVEVNGKVITKTRHNVQADDDIILDAELSDKTYMEAEDIPLDIIYEDDDLIVINKPAGLVVHPGAGNYAGTLLNALLHHDQSLATIPRAGIVHRLDKDTSGLLVIARNLETHNSLIKMMQEREIKREYETIVHGDMVAGGSIDEPIGRHPTQRIKMAVTRGGREALTHYRILKKFPKHTYLRVILDTGRTHQIRVHMAHLRHPIVGDKTYGKKTQDTFPRQALHAARLSLTHPRSGEDMQWQAPLPQDMQALLADLEPND